MLFYVWLIFLFPFFFLFNTFNSFSNSNVTLDVSEPVCKRHPKWHIITLYKQNGKKGMLREMTRHTSPGSFVRVGWWCITSPVLSIAAQHVLEECTGEMLHLVTSCSVSVKANPLCHHVLRQAAKKPLDLLQSWTVSHVPLRLFPKLHSHLIGHVFNLFPDYYGYFGRLCFWQRTWSCVFVFLRLLNCNLPCNIECLVFNPVLITIR